MGRTFKRKMKRSKEVETNLNPARPSKWILHYLETGNLPDERDTTAYAEYIYLLLAGNNSLGLPEKTNMYNPKEAWFHLAYPDRTREEVTKKEWENCDPESFDIERYTDFMCWGKKQTYIRENSHKHKKKVK